MSYNQSHNPRQSGSRQHGSRPGSGNSQQTANYDVPPYEQSAHENEDMWRENRIYRQNEGNQDYRRNQDYRSSQQDYQNFQRDYDLSGTSDNDWEQWGQWRGTQGGGGERPFPFQRNQYPDQEGYYPPQGANARWENNPSQNPSRRNNPGYSNTQWGGGNNSSAGGNFRGRAPKGYERSDERIREDLCERLTLDPQVDASEITVTVKSGVITLEGSISDRGQKYRAEDLADNISGVKDVQNRLNVARNMQRGTGVGTDSGNHESSRSGQESERSQSSPQNTTRQ
ncbi:MAG: BON domain-containing protein [Spongiibacteraceae bacterium]